MLGHSHLFFGLLSETPEAAQAQVELWDRSTVWQASWDQASKAQGVAEAGKLLSERIAKPLVGQIRKDLSNVIRPKSPPQSAVQQSGQHPLDSQIMKFCRLLDHAQLKLQSLPSVIELHDLCLAIERHAIETLRKADDRSMVSRLKGVQKAGGFEGTTTDDLVRFVIQKTFDQLDADFKKKTPEEQEAIAGRIASALRELRPEEQERIKKAARLPDLTAETLRQTGRFAGLGVGLSSMVGVAGFSAYTSLTTVVAVVTGLLGVHLSFGTYTALVSSLAGLSNPLVMVGVVAGGATWMTRKANRSIRAVLYPTFVATSVMSNACREEEDLPAKEFASRIGSLIDQIESADGQHLDRLMTSFPRLGSVSLQARLLSRVTT